MYNEIITICVLLAVIVVQVIYIILQRQDSLKVQTDLLNRIMARNYETYVQAEIAKREEKKELTPEEIYAMQAERGIPV
jgi:hypothetical protein